MSGKFGKHLPAVVRAEIVRMSLAVSRKQFSIERAMQELAYFCLDRPTGIVDLESRDFYELCQQYRNQPLDAAKEFEAIKAFILTGALPWPSYDDD